jgi:hypothetical protein
VALIVPEAVSVPAAMVKVNSVAAPMSFERPAAVL